MKSINIELIKSKYLHILSQCRYKRVKDYTQKECAEYLDCSLKKFSNFENAKLFDFFLLCDFALFLDIEIDITYKSLS
jgi:hypothetical protein